MRLQPASNVRAYIMDTGARFTHTTFGGRATSGRDTVDNDNNAADCNGHGAHVAGTVGGSQYGVARGVQIVGVRVLNCQGSGSNSGVVAGVDWVTANAVKPAVANMSRGGSAGSALDTAVRNSVKSGITYGLAAGNSNANACNSSPARDHLSGLRQAPVTLGSTTLATYSNLNKNSTYTQKSFNVACYAGQTVTLKFTGVEDSSLATSFVVDDTAVTVS